jgi:hypothetical protein
MDAPCTSTLDAAHLQYIAGAVYGYTLHIHTAGDGKGYTLHLYNVSGGKWMHPAHQHCVRWKWIHPHIHTLLVVERVYPSVYTVDFRQDVSLSDDEFVIGPCRSTATNDNDRK